MKLSTERILTTHVGSLQRPRSLLDLILAKEEGRLVDVATFEAQSGDAVTEVVAQQVAAGVDIVSDGEMSKPSYATYVKHRVDGIGMDAAAAEKGRQVMLSLDRLDHPDFVAVSDPQEFFVGLVAMLVMPRRPEIGTVELQEKPGCYDRLVFCPHDVGEGLEVSVLVAVIGIDDKPGQDTGRRCGHKSLGRLCLFERGP